MPFSGMRVHAESWIVVDLDDDAAALDDGVGDVRGNEIDAGHVEPDDHGRLTGNLDVVGVDVVGAIDRGTAGAHIAGQLELDVLTCFRHVLEYQSLFDE